MKEGSVDGVFLAGTKAADHGDCHRRSDVAKFVKVEPASGAWLARRLVA
jgi:hypothetical protein